jgi:hypothetical protein
VLMISNFIISLSLCRGRHKQHSLKIWYIVSVLVVEYAMSINSQNRETRAIITSTFDVIQQY